MNINSEARYTLQRAAYVPLALLAQVTIAPALSILGVQPSLLLVVFVLFAFRAGVLAATWMGFACGLLLDTYSSGGAGAFALALAITGFLTGQLHERRMHVSYPLRVTVLGVATLLHDGIWHASSRHGFDALGSFLVRVSLPGALYTMILGAILFAFRPPKIHTRNW
jgi:rod shape-determining protein MreD